MLCPLVLYFLKPAKPSDYISILLNVQRTVYRYWYQMEINCYMNIFVEFLLLFIKKCISYIHPCTKSFFSTCRIFITFAYSPIHPHTTSAILKLNALYTFKFAYYLLQFLNLVFWCHFSSHKNKLDCKWHKKKLVYCA